MFFGGDFLKQRGIQSKKKKDPAKRAERMFMFVKNAALFYSSWLQLDYAMGSSQ